MRAKGGRLAPGLESALLRNAVSSSDGKIVDLRIISPLHAKMSGPVASGTLTDGNAQNIAMFPRKGPSSADEKSAAISSRSDEI